MATLSVEQQNTAITTAATTTVLDALAGANDEARIKVGMMTIRNKGEASNTVTIQKKVTSTVFEMSKFTLAAGDEKQNPWDTVLKGNTTSLEIVTSSTSEIHVCLSYIKKVVA